MIAAGGDHCPQSPCSSLKTVATRVRNQMTGMTIQLHYGWRLCHEALTRDELPLNIYISEAVAILPMQTMLPSFPPRILNFSQSDNMNRVTTLRAFVQHARRSIPTRCLTQVNRSAGPSWCARRYLSGTSSTKPQSPSLQDSLQDSNSSPNVGRKQVAEFNLAGRTFVVTGGAQGLGLTLAEGLVEAGGNGKPQQQPQSSSSPTLISNA